MKFETNMVFIHFFLKGLNTVSCCLLFIGFVSKFIQSGSAILKWFFELSYPIYIVHYFPLMIISAGLYGVGLNQIIIFLLTIIIGFIVCIIF